MGILRYLITYQSLISLKILEFEETQLAKDLSFMWLTDPNSGKKSVTLTLFVSGFITSCIKLIISGIVIVDKVKFSDFSGTDFALIMTSLGGIYTLRKAQSTKQNIKHEEKNT